MLELLPVGWAVLVLLVAAVHRPRTVRNPVPVPGPSRRHGWWPALVVAVAVLVDVRLAAAVAIGSWIAPVVARRRARLDAEAAVVRELPEAIDLLALALGAGGSVHAAVALVARRPLGPVSAALEEVHLDVGRGRLLAEALDRRLSRLGEPVRPLLRALVGGDRDGIEIGPTLDRLADEARDARRRRALAEARRIPVRMLLPLTLAVLPAFVVLTVVPTLAATFEGLRSGSP